MMHFVDPEQKLTVDLRVYAIVDPEHAGGRPLPELARMVAQGGATLVQLRDKVHDTQEMIALARDIKAALPPLISWTVILFQGTSLAGWVGTTDLFNMAKSQGAQDYRYLYHLLLAAALYALISIPFLALAAQLERRQNRGSIRGLLRSLLRSPATSAA